MGGYLIRDGALSSPGTGGPRRCPVGKLLSRAGSISPYQPTPPVGVRLPHFPGQYRPGGYIRFRPRVIRVVSAWKGF